MILRAIAISITFAARVVAQQQESPPQNQPAGLSTLSDDTLMNDLAARGMDSLLERAFELNKVPAPQRDARRAVIALRELALNPTKLPAKQRQELIDRVLRGIDAALPAMSDPATMMQQAGVLIDAAAERHVNTLELWGDSPAARAALNPVARTVVALYDRAATEGMAAAERMGDQSATDEGRIEQAYALSQLAAFNARMSDYFLLLSLDPASDARRQIAERALAYLSPLDAPDQPVRVAVRLRSAKIQLARGDTEAAKKLLDPVADDASFTPKPSALEQYQARYFRAAAEMMARRLDEAQRLWDELGVWSKQNMPTDRATRDMATAASAVLQYRIHEARAAAAQDQTARRAAESASVQTLSKLMSDRPDLAGSISELLISRLHRDAPLAELNPLLLQALVRRGEEERLKPDPSHRQPAVMRRAIAAARELLGRSEAIDATLADNCRFVIPFLLETLGDNPQAAVAFMDYAESAPVNSERAMIALDHARVVVARLRAASSAENAPATQPTESADVAQLYERFLRLAIDRFKRREFAFEYARRLQLLDRPLEACRYFAVVPADDSRWLTARFFYMLALKQTLDALATDDAARRAAVVAQIQTLADEVAGAVAKSNDPAARQSMVVRTKLLAAELARTEGRDPRRAINLLANIEPALAGLPDADRLLPEILLIRVQSYMALNESSNATNELKTLLDSRDEARGSAIVFELLQKLNEELESARAAGDSSRMAAVARNRAQLSGFLVKRAQDSTDENIRKFTYRYRVFDAASKRLAADLEPEETIRRTLRDTSLALYRALETPENFALYLAMLPPREAQSAQYDPAVSFAIATLCFDLGQMTEARDRLSRLLNDRRLGPPVVSSVDEIDGVRRETDNDPYWEAVLKFVRANLALGENVEQSKSYVREQCVRWGDRVGGRRWKEEFEKLKSELK